MSASRRKGTAAKTAMVRWLQAHGFPFAERRALRGRDDQGDVAGIPGIALEVKNCNRTELAVWTDEAKAECCERRSEYVCRNPQAARPRRSR